MRRRPIPWAPLVKPLADTTIALISTAGVAAPDDVPFDVERERRDPWRADPTYRSVSQNATERDVQLPHLHIDRRFGEEDLDVVLPMRRLRELAAEGLVGRPAERHYSIEP